jgi:phosphatidylserine decarboxylase
MPFANLIHPDGWKFIGLFTLGAFFLSLLSTTLGFVGIALTLWCVYFFRSPPRVTPIREGLVVSPADGKVVLIQQVIPSEALGLGLEARYRVSIFLNIFDVHVNRLPVSGTVKDIIYHPGKFLNASLDKASEENERNTLVIQGHDGNTYGVTQIAGLIARRIRCDVSVGDEVKAGTVYGLIRFGSRADVYLPVGIKPQVIVGQRAVAGETVLADLNSDEDLRAGEMR